MTQPVNPKLAKLLKEKGFDEKCSHYYIDNFQNFKHDGILYKTGLPNDWDNDNILQFVKRTNQPRLCNAPNHCRSSNVVIWIYSTQNGRGSFQWNLDYNCMGDKGMLEFNSPTEAYEYTLKNLIK